MATANLAALNEAIGDSTGSARQAKEALGMFELLDHGPGAALCQGTLAELARRQQDWTEANDRLDLGFATCQGPDGTAARLQLLRTRAQVHLDRGELLAGLEVAGSAYDECSASGLEWLLSDLSVVLARALVMNEEPERALAATETADGKIQDAARMYWRMQAYEMIGDRKAAFEALETAHEAMTRTQPSEPN